MDKETEELFATSDRILKAGEFWKEELKTLEEHHAEKTKQSSQVDAKSA